MVMPLLRQFLENDWETVHAQDVQDSFDNGSDSKSVKTVGTVADNEPVDKKASNGTAYPSVTPFGSNTRNEEGTDTSDHQVPTLASGSYPPSSMLLELNTIKQDMKTMHDSLSRIETVLRAGRTDRHENTHDGGPSGVATDQRPHDANLRYVRQAQSFPVGGIPIGVIERIAANLMESPTTPGDVASKLLDACEQFAPERPDNKEDQGMQARLINMEGVMDVTLGRVENLEKRFKEVQMDMEGKEDDPLDMDIDGNATHD